eukprot:scpid20183/ scgid34426/ Tubulin-specific chaperone D; Beta-tubulin cofactor D; SSD-1; Tubulin-folding cofactor D
MAKVSSTSSKPTEGDSMADDRCGIGSALEYCVEKDELLRIISGLPSLPDEARLERFAFITNNYQEQPHLLDPHMETMLRILMEYGCSPQSTESVRHQAFKYVYQLTKVRGRKYIVRLLSHEVADLEPALALLNAQNPRDHETWETRYVLLLWLTIISLVPFDMKLFDGGQSGASDSADSAAAGGGRQLPIMERILDVAKRYLSVTDTSRDAASLLIAKFISRPDVRPLHLASTVAWLHTSIVASSGRGVGHGYAGTSVAGALSTLSALFKHGRREDLLEYSESTYHSVTGSQLLNSSNTLLRKLAVKLVQRVGLILLPTRVCAWRYQRGSRSLLLNLGQDNGGGGGDGVEAAASSSAQAGQDEEDEFDVPEVIESILETIWTSLCDKDTVVRWSAAKGVGRIAARLPKSFGDEVVAFLLSLFSPTSTHAAWHGGCLALAELGRRGLLEPGRLAEVVPVVVSATAYDQLYGSCSIGSHVRDAACYVCWSFARAYEPKDIEQYVDEIARALVITTVFDREINCRRAASAAFQENVGRQGTFPNGIDIVTMADYFAVGNRQNAYLNLSVQIGKFEKYCVPLIEACVGSKLNHWDGSVRELASKALHNLTEIAPEYMATTVLPRVVDRCSHLSIRECHGGVLAVGQICYALSKLCKSHVSKTSLRDWVADDVIDEINDVISVMKASNLFKGVHSIETRMAASSFIENLSKAEFPVRDSTVLESWQWLIDDSLPFVDNTNAGVTDSALAALTPFTAHYYSQPDVTPDHRGAIVDGYCRELKSKLVFPRMGFSLALGALPPIMLQSKVTQILSSLVAATHIEAGVESQFAEARRDAVKALGRFCLTAGFHEDMDPTYHLPVSTTVSQVYDACLMSMQDYTTDSRGDIGAHVREASMLCLQDLTMSLAETHPAALTEPLMLALMTSLLQQISEKIDRTRSVAGGVIAKLLHSDSPVIPCIPEREALTAVLTETLCSKLNWASASDAFPHTVQLLSVAPYRQSVLTGLIVSVGGMTESLVKHASGALVEFLEKFTASDENLAVICSDILSIFKKYQKVDRVTVPLLKALDVLLSSGCFEQLTSRKDAKFPTDLLALCKAETARSGDAKKLIDSVPVFCGLLPFPGLRLPCLRQLTILLGHKYPRVRAVTADYFVVALVSYADIVLPTGDEDAGGEDDPMTILSTTAWDDAALAEVREARNRICNVLEIPVPKALAPTAAKSGAQSAAAKTAAHKTKAGTYQDLVNSAGY